MHDETDDQEIDRLETNIAAALRNHALLVAAGPVVERNNVRLRGAMATIADQWAADGDLHGIVDGLREALAAPPRYERPTPPEFALVNEEAPTSPRDRIAWLAARLRACQRANYLLQEHGSPIVWNSDELRETVRRLVRDFEGVEGAKTAVADMRAAIGMEG